MPWNIGRWARLPLALLATAHGRRQTAKQACTDVTQRPRVCRCYKMNIIMLCNRLGDLVLLLLRHPFGALESSRVRPLCVGLLPQERRPPALRLICSCTCVEAVPSVEGISTARLLTHRAHVAPWGCGQCHWASRSLQGHRPCGWMPDAVSRRLWLWVTNRPVVGRCCVAALLCTTPCPWTPAPP